MPTRGYRKGLSGTKTPLTCFVRTRLSAEEYAKLNRDRRPRSMTVSKFLRAIVKAHLSNQRAELPHPRGLTDDLLREFSRIGNNLNQLAKQANEQRLGVNAHDLRQCLDTLNTLARSL